MARKSFTLQKITPDYGSYVQYPSGSGAASVGFAVREDDDTRLKSDGILIAPILNSPTRIGSLLSYIAYFEAEVSDYNEVILSWDAPLNDLSLVEGADTVVATGIVIVYSQDGEPQTISDGNILINDNTSQTYYHQVPNGTWAYYTLFVKFESRNGDLYYEPAAKLAVLTPNKYNSVDTLYARIPEYYRLLDGDMDEGFGGPLYRYLSIFGYEIDKVRTVVDHMMVMKDPQLANSQVLDYLSQDLGIGVRVHELGASRLRTLINIIGFLRRSEGTKSALELAVQALTGSDVEVDTANNEIKVYAQRVNLLKDPNLEVLIAGLLDGGLAGTPSFTDDVDAGEIIELYNDDLIDQDWVYDPNDPNQPGNITTTEGNIFVGGTPAVTGGTLIDENQNPSWIYEPDPSSGGSVSVLMTFAKTIDPPPPNPPRGDYIRVKSGDKLYYSMHLNPTFGVQDLILRVRLMWDNGLGIEAVAEATTSVQIAGINYWELEVIDGHNDYINTFLFIDVPATVDAVDSFGEMLLEREIGGSYFDGHTSLGGWLIDSDTISDYRWFNEEDPDSSIELNRTDTFSVYNSNYSKTRAVVHRMISSYLPITELTTGSGPIYPNQPIPSPKWNVTFNHIPGVY